MTNPFAYNSVQPRFDVRQLRQNKHWRHYTVDFPIAFPGLYQESNTAIGEYFQSQALHKAPLAILIHGWGDHSTFPMHFLARNLTRKGIHCFVLYLPFHSRRLPREMKKRSPNFTQEEWFDGYRIAVTDVRQILDWAENRDEIDKKRVAVVGLSLGAFVSSIAMGIDDRINAGVFIVSGGNSAKIQQHSRFAKFRKQYRFEQKDYEDYQKSYEQYLQDVAVRGWENIEPARQSFFIDPLTYAYRLKKRPVLMINALWDEFIPRENTLEFQKACGGCELIWFPTSHATIWSFYSLIARRIYRFLHTALHSLEDV
ncbi:MAG TPA: alpha/beta fold hydrolase [Dehalococcoidales bacterium]